jgi:hypothetical protein
MQLDSEGAGPWAGRWSRDVYLEESRGRGPLRGPARRPPPAPARATTPPGQITVHYDEDAGHPGDEEGGSLGLRIGARLKHPQFGVGEVRGWQSAGKDLKVTMRFPAAGVKTILARFLTRP